MQTDTTKKQPTNKDDGNPAKKAKTGSQVLCAVRPSAHIWPLNEKTGFTADALAVTLQGDSSNIVFLLVSSHCQQLLHCLLKLKLGALRRSKPMI